MNVIFLLVSKVSFIWYVLVEYNILCLLIAPFLYCSVACIYFLMLFVFLMCLSGGVDKYGKHACYPEIKVHFKDR